MIFCWNFLDRKIYFFTRVWSRWVENVPFGIFGNVKGILGIFWEGLSKFLEDVEAQVGTRIIWGNLGIIFEVRMEKDTKKNFCKIFNSQFFLSDSKNTPIITNKSIKHSQILTQSSHFHINFASLPSIKFIKWIRKTCVSFKKEDNFIDKCLHIDFISVKTLQRHFCRYLIVSFFRHLNQ